MKSYPFSLQKHAHSIELYYNHVKNTLADMESGEIPMDAARYAAWWTSWTRSSGLFIQPCSTARTAVWST